MVRAWPPRPRPDRQPIAVTRTARPTAAANRSPLDQLPAWRELVPVMDAGARRPRRRPGSRRCSAASTRTSCRAVTHGDGPLLVVAGAGTGKTQVITRRIAWLIATRRARPSEILALTFTDKAAEEMAVRVDQLVPYGYTDTAISTFHAFGDRLIREYALELGLPTDLRVLTRAEVVIFLREHLFEFDLDAYRPLGDPTRFLAALATLFSRCKDEDITPADYLAHADRLAAEAARVAEAAGGEAPDARRRRCGRRGGPPAGRAGPRLRDATRTCWPRTAASTSATRSRSRCGSCATSPAARTRDRRPLPVHPRRRVPGHEPGPGGARRRCSPSGHRNVTVVGDDDQAIYAFRGAAVDNILDFQDRYPGARTVVLRRNYRSLAPILDAAYRLIRFNDPDRLEVRTGIVKRLRAAAASTPAAAPVRLEAFATGAEEADWIAAEIGAPDRGRRRAARPRGPRPGQRPRRPDPARAQHGRHPVAVLGHVRPVRPARGPAAAGVPAGRRRPRIERRPVRPRGVGRLRPRRRGPDRDRQHGPPPQSLGLGDPRGARPPAGHPARLARRRATAVARLVADLRALRRRSAHERPAGEVLYAFLRDSGLLGAARRRPTRRPPRRRSRTSPASSRSSASQSALLADDRAVFVAPPPRRRSSRPATTRPPPSSTPTPTRSPS